jgi:hypothetical protein
MCCVVECLKQLVLHVDGEFHLNVNFKREIILGSNRQAGVAGILCYLVYSLFSYLFISLLLF